jgi:hypothetical protein
VHRDQDDRCSRRRGATCRPARDRRRLGAGAEHDECLKKLAALERAIELAEARL